MKIFTFTARLFWRSSGAAALQAQHPEFSEHNVTPGNEGLQHQRPDFVICRAVSVIPEQTENFVRLLASLASSPASACVAGIRDTWVRRLYVCVEMLWCNVWVSPHCISRSGKLDKEDDERQNNGSAGDRSAPDPTQLFQGSVHAVAAVLSTVTIPSTDQAFSSPCTGNYLLCVLIWTDIHQRIVREFLRIV